MAGHNKWTQIKRQKGASDAKRSQLFGKLSKMISTQVKISGGDKNVPSVRAIIEKARNANMPVDTIERAINKATEVKEMESVTYEAYGPGGVGLIIETLTDNKNRTAQDIKHILTEHGTALGGIGSVTWAFNKEMSSEGMILKPSSTVSLSDSDLELLEKLVEDLENNDDVQEVYTNAE